MVDSKMLKFEKILGGIYNPFFDCIKKYVGNLQIWSDIEDKKERLDVIQKWSEIRERGINNIIKEYEEVTGKNVGILGTMVPDAEPFYMRPKEGFIFNDDGMSHEKETDKLFYKLNLNKIKGYLTQLSKLAKGFWVDKVEDNDKICSLVMKDKYEDLIIKVKNEPSTKKNGKNEIKNSTILSFCLKYFMGEGYIDRAIYTKIIREFNSDIRAYKTNIRTEPLDTKKRLMISNLLKNKNEQVYHGEEKEFNDIKKDWYRTMLNCRIFYHKVAVHINGRQNIIPLF